MKQKSKRSNRWWTILQRSFVMGLLLLFSLILLTSQPVRASLTQTPANLTIDGPFITKDIEPYLYTGSLLDLAGTPDAGAFQPQWRSCQGMPSF